MKSICGIFREEGGSEDVFVAIDCVVVQSSESSISQLCVWRLVFNRRLLRYGALL